MILFNYHALHFHTTVYVFVDEFMYISNKKKVSEKNNYDLSSMQKCMDQKYDIPIVFVLF